MGLLGLFLLIASLPVILVFVFLELNAEKQSGSEQATNDGRRKLAKILGWGFVSILVALLISSFLEEEGYAHVRGIIKIIEAFLHLLS